MGFSLLWVCMTGLCLIKIGLGYKRQILTHIQNDPAGREKTYQKRIFDLRKMTFARPFDLILA